ncbi:MAG: hypothetical protein NC343_01375 [Muribaculum sp.]|nr:hypothetical protein [Muribaculaceae bacterium]MCM1080387.1 hypothetical protein [Muribaculum sp.]
MKNYLNFVVLVLAMLLPIVSSAMAYQSVSVEYKDGSTFLLQGESGLSLDITNSELHFSAPSGTTFSVAIADVKGWSYSSKKGNTGFSAIDEVVLSQISIELTNNTLQLDNLPENSNVTLFFHDGKMLKQVCASGVCTINLADIPAGLYILTINNKSFKFAI